MATDVGVWLYRRYSARSIRIYIIFQRAHPLFIQNKDTLAYSVFWGGLTVKLCLIVQTVQCSHEHERERIQTFPGKAANMLRVGYSLIRCGLSVPSLEYKHTTRRV